jgi:uncharacterized membrane protein YgdD (TMEM256/DUF423 family)
VKKNIILGCFFSLGIATALGALAAHGLKAKLSPESLNSFETAVKYQFYNSIALLGVSGLKEKVLNVLAIPLKLIVAGGIIFSGSIYLLVFFKHLKIAWMVTILGPITPLGGSLLVAGYIMAAFFSHSRLLGKI